LKSPISITILALLGSDDAGLEEASRLRLPRAIRRSNMRATLRKTIVGSLAALAIGVSAIGSVGSASAAPYYPHGGYHGGWHRGGWWGPAVGFGIAGLAAGAIVASQAPYGYYGYGGCTAYRPVFDAYGNYLGRRLVNVC
jgi:hypothetical protein